MSLKEIFCQDKAVSILQRARVAGKLAHSYIFTGREGIGKFTTACQWAKLLLCENPVATEDFADSCSQCESCRLFEAGSHPDFNHVYKELREFTKDGKGKTRPVDLPIDVIREFLIDKVSIRPNLSGKKVFIISEAEKLNTYSQNSLLKVLEEPPEYCTIILLCTRAEKLLPTIKSRCQMIRFGPIDQEVITEKIKQMGIEEKIARYFARLADGSLGNASQWAKLQLQDANLYQLKKQLVNSLADYQYSQSIDLAKNLLDESKKIADTWTKMDGATSKTDINRRSHKIIIRIIVSILHDAMKMGFIDPQTFVNFDQQEQIKKLARHFKCERAAEKIANTCETMRWIDANVNEKLIFEHLLLNLAVSDTMKG